MRILMSLLIGLALVLCGCPEKKVQKEDPKLVEPTDVKAADVKSDEVKKEEPKKEEVKAIVPEEVKKP